MEKGIQSVLETEEEILWEGKQDLKTTVILSAMGSILLLVIAGILFFTNVGASTSCVINGVEKVGSECTKMMSTVSIVLFFLGLFAPLAGYLSYKVTHYVIDLSGNSYLQLKIMNSSYQIKS